jgi:integrative and conjugative element protein (TIGR02256 family)
MSHETSEVALHPAASDAITAETRRALPLESGGILLGYREGLRIVVTHALVVATNTGTTNRYVRDDVRANALLREFLNSRDPEDPTGYVGEWHSHPAPFGPSSIDLNAIRATARATAASVALVVHSPAKMPRFAGNIAKRQRLGRITTEEVTVALPDPQYSELGPLPEGAVRGDGPVFISYRQSDGTLRADSLEGLLRAAGLVVWRDRSDLRAGTTTDRLEQALTAGLSAAVLIVTASCPGFSNSTRTLDSASASQTKYPTPRTQPRQTMWRPTAFSPSHPHTHLATRNRATAAPRPDV